MKRLAYVSIYITLHTLRKYFFNFTITDVLHYWGGWRKRRPYFVINPFVARPFFINVTFAQNELLA